MSRRGKRLNRANNFTELAPHEVDNSHVPNVCKTCNGHGWLCKTACWRIPRTHSGKPCPDCDRRGTRGDPDGAEG